MIVSAILFGIAAVFIAAGLYMDKWSRYALFIVGFIMITVGLALIVIPRAPSPPTNIVAIAGNAMASISFLAVPNATSYTVTSSMGNRTATGTTSPLLVTGLVNNKNYTFTVTATSQNGTSAPSDISNIITPQLQATAPVNIKAVGGNSSAIISFTRTDAGLARTFTVTSTPGSISETGTLSPITVSGLTNGVSYTFKVTATNAIGNSFTSLPSNAITPTPPLYIPTSVTAIPLNRSASVSFETGSAGLTYTVMSFPGSISAIGTTSPIIVPGLNNGTAYTFTVKSTNQWGTSEPSASSNPVTPIATPMAPTNAHVIMTGIGEAYVGFDTPYSLGSGVSYTVTSTPGNIQTTSTISTILVTGLTSGLTYSFTVISTNASGNSSPSNATTPVLIP